MPNPVVIALLAAVALAFVVRGALAVGGPAEPPGSRPARSGLTPRTRLGWWSLGLAIVYVLLLASMEIVPGVDPFDSDPGLLTLAQRLVFGLTAAAAVATGWIAVRRGDRCLLLYVAIALVVWVGLVPVVGSFVFE